MSINNILLGTLLGDSYLGKKKNYASFRISHCPEQLDYLNHIAELIRKDKNEHISVYYRSNRNIYELYHHGKCWISWREKYYPNDKKSIINILNDITDPIEAVAYWLMDDGCIHYSTKNKNFLSPRLLLATCSETKETHEFMIQWFFKHFGIKPYITIQRNRKRNTEWMLLKFKVEDSYKLWQLVRHKIITIPSMKYKFRIVEQEFNKEYYRTKYFQERPLTQEVKNVCRTDEELKPSEDQNKKSDR